LCSSAVIATCELRHSIPQRHGPVTVNLVENFTPSIPLDKWRQCLFLATGLPTPALQQVGNYLCWTGRDADVRQERSQ
jgi:hypothetical protein